MRKLVSYKKPKTTAECELLKADLVDKMLGIQAQLEDANIDSFSEESEFHEWEKNTKQLYRNLQRGIVRINLIKREIIDKASKEPKQENNRHVVIQKAFGLLCNDIISDSVPQFNTAKDLAGHYILLATFPDGNVEVKTEIENFDCDDEEE